MKGLQATAQAMPGVEVGVACAGTALEKRTYKVGGKAFVFLGAKDVMVKLGPSIAAAKKLGCSPGANGWTKVVFGPEAPREAILVRWIAESYALMAPVTPVAKKSTKRKAKR
jgi:hypothetical protein